jgi:CelD/BcsL family acetyltransferase involved in cellulose biosynthesis
MSFEIRVLQSPEEFERIRDEWNALTDRCVYPNSFIRAEWILIWWKWFGKTLGTFHTVTVHNENRLVAGLPLFREKNGTLKLIGFDGMTCPEYLGLVVEPELIHSASAVLVDFLTEHTNWNELFFEDYAVEDLGTSRFAELLKQRFSAWERTGEGRYYIPLPASYDEYLMTRGQMNRYKKRKELKKATEEYRARLVELDFAEIDQWFPVLRRLGISALAHKAVPPMQHDNFAGMVHDLIAELLPRKEFQIFLLYYGDTPAAFKMGFTFAGKFFDYQTGFDVSLPGRAGNIVIHFIIKRLIEEGFKEFDFLRGLEDYKTHWTEYQHPTQTLAVFRRKGIAYYRTLFLENFLRPVWRKFKNFRTIFIFGKKNRDKKFKEQEQKIETPAENDR